MGKPSRIRIDTALLRVPQHCCDFIGCNKYFSKLSRLKYHQNTHLQQKPYKCEYPGCSSAYYRPNHLKRHVDSIHSDNGGQADSKGPVLKDFRCLHEGCKATFDTESSLYFHEKRKHSTLPFKCSFCDKSFGKKWQIKEHEASHTGACPFKCDVENCNEEFKDYLQFKSHQREHIAKSRILECPDPDCTQTFQKWSELASHKKSHRKVVGTHCTICKKTFTQRNLKVHLPIHQEERQTFQCTFDGCPRFYFHQKNLTHHVKVKHEGLGFNCTQCDKKLSTKQKLLHHIEIIHNKKSGVPKAKKKKKLNLLNKLDPMKDDDWNLKKTGPARYIRLKYDSIKFPDKNTADGSGDASQILPRPEPSDPCPDDGNNLVNSKPIEMKNVNLTKHFEKIPCLSCIH